MKPGPCTQSHHRLPPRACVFCAVFVVQYWSTGVQGNSDSNRGRIVLSTGANENIEFSGAEIPIDGNWHHIVVCSNPGSGSSSQARTAFKNGGQIARRRERGEGETTTRMRVAVLAVESRLTCICCCCVCSAQVGSASTSSNNLALSVGTFAVGAGAGGGVQNGWVGHIDEVTHSAHSATHTHASQSCPRLARSLVFPLCCIALRVSSSCSTWS